MYVTWRIDYTPFIDGTWSNDNLETLTTYYNPLVRVKLGATKDDFQFDLTNFNDTQNAKFNPLNRIQIYRTINTDSINTTTDLIMNGTVNDSPDTDNASSNKTMVKGYNFSEAVMSAIIFLDARSLTIPQALEQALKKAGNNNNFKITWHPNNPSLKSDGNAFENPAEKWFNWTLLKILEQYSSNTYTKDGTYFWYVDNQNRLVWRQRDSVSNYSFNTEVDSYLELKSGKDKNGVKNYIVAKGGFDAAGTPIQVKYADYANIATNGKKYYMLIPKTANGGTINKDDLNKSWGSTTPTDKYPNTYDFTTTWTSSITATVAGVSMVEGSNVTVSNDTEYNAVLRAHIKGLLLKEAKQFVDNHQYGTYKIDVTFEAGRKSWGLGDKITTTAPQVFDGVKTLRVTDIQYSSTIDVYSLEEDADRGTA